MAKRWSEGAFGPGRRADQAPAATPVTPRHVVQAWPRRWREVAVRRWGRIRRSRSRVGWWRFPARLCHPMCRRCSTPRSMARRTMIRQLVGDRHARHVGHASQQLAWEAHRGSLVPTALSRDSGDVARLLDGTPAVLGRPADAHEDRISCHFSPGCGREVAAHWHTLARTSGTTAGQFRRPPSRHVRPVALRQRGSRARGGSSARRRGR